ncbi:tyrosinase cofactor [Streptomyces sp. NBC_01275]|uniref:apotyrosinase chaperone MelC1 n=1 Tax=Streptomyces sp. NBC_01275 TaxID=2903807 RepID=UPI0022542A24|nr:tyrosinase family oxidase copper chaperone [Streptomyces sp. NBC_01275]MCX4767530.1 tyrosinase cofactor [Streptomyces sp. NBC_01275]
MPELTRRHALAAAAVAAGAQLLTAPAARAEDHRHDGHDSPASFDEVYKGRRIQGRPTSGGGHHHGGGYGVYVDGVELHVMRNADGSWISVVSHYDPVATPRAAARAAVDELQGARLLPFPASSPVPAN